MRYRSMIVRAALVAGIAAAGWAAWSSIDQAPAHAADKPHATQQPATPPDKAAKLPGQAADQAEHAVNKAPRPKPKAGPKATKPDRAASKPKQGTAHRPRPWPRPELETPATPAPGTHPIRDIEDDLDDAGNEVGEVGEVGDPPSSTPVPPPAPIPAPTQAAPAPLPVTIGPIQGTAVDIPARHLAAPPAAPEVPQCAGGQPGGTGGHGRGAVRLPAAAGPPASPSTPCPGYPVGRAEQLTAVAMKPPSPYDADLIGDTPATATWPTLQPLHELPGRSGVPASRTPHLEPGPA